MRNIEKVVILGGGTAGWLTATYLQRAFPNKLEITLVESEQIPRIGVGEATVPTIRSTFAFLGLEESDWMPKTGGSFKNAVRFVNWNGGGSSDSFYHPFHHQRYNQVDLYGQSYFMDIDGRLPLGHFWLREKLGGRDNRPFAYACSPNSQLCDENKAPRSPEMPNRSLNYAYHFDAALIAGYLRGIAESRGVKRVAGNFKNAARSENGFIESIQLEDGRKISADFFVDCSGFRSLLLTQTLKENFENQNNHLLCDSAVAVSAEYKNRKEQFSPYTSAVALSSGWRWIIPLQHRMGTGYVYSANHIDKSQAEEELCRSVGQGNRGDLGFNHIKMRVGYHPNVWSGNCVAIGLAGSFIEPLESTSIFMTEFQLFNLVRHFPNKDCAPALRNQYNKLFRECYREVRDFIVMHYIYSPRTDTPFWIEAKKEIRIPDSLREKMELFRERLPLDSDIKNHLFHAFNYTCLLDGMGALPKSATPSLHYVTSQAGPELLSKIKEQTKDYSAEFPTLDEYFGENEFHLQ